MIPLSAAEAAAALGLERFVGPVTGISTDSRSIAAGDLFVALRGETYDGRRFVPAAFAAGASAALVGPAIGEEDAWGAGVPPDRVCRVPDTREALGALARAVRRKSAALVIAVTGSAGKTSTKDLLRAAVARSCRVVSTEANQNNEIGVPLTLLRVEVDTEAVILEMGMRGRGQIGALSAMAEPDVGVVTSIAPVHLELVGDLKGVAAAKAELFTGMGPAGVAVIPDGEPLLEEQVDRTGHRVVRFSFGQAGQGGVRGAARHLDESRALLELSWPEGQVAVEVPFSGHHRLHNAVAAMAACYAAGLPMDASAAGLGDVRFTPLRGDEYQVGAMLVLDDSYNANPVAVVGAIADLTRRARGRGVRAVAVLGDMRELGASEDQYHHDVGVRAAEAGVGLLVGVGPLSAETVRGYRERVAAGDAGTDLPERAALHVAELETGLTSIVAGLRDDDVVLVKASRSMQLERVVAALRGAGR